MTLYPNPLNRLKDRMRGRVTPAILNPLTWVWSEGFAFENAAAGTVVGTPVGKSAGSTLSIVSVTSMAKTYAGDSAFIAAPLSLFQIIGDAVCAGTTPMDYETAGSDVYGHGYLVTVRETLGVTTRDTVLPVLVFDLPELGASFTDTFSDPDNTALIGRSVGGVAWTGSGVAASQANFKIVGGSLTILGTGTSNLAYASRDVGSTDMAIAFDLLAASVGYFGNYLRRTSTTNYIRFGVNANGRSIGANYRSTASGGEVSIADFTPNGNNPIPLIQGSDQPNPGAPTRVGCIVIGNLVYLTYNDVIIPTVTVGGVATPNGVAMANPPATTGAGSAAITLGTQATAGTTFSYDNLAIGAPVGFSMLALPKVLPADPTSGQAVVPLRGGLTGAPTLEWQLETAAGAVVEGFAWQPLHATIANGAWSKFVNVPRAAGRYNYVAKVRDTAAPTTIVSAAFGVGEIAAGIGQSNMGHMAYSIASSPTTYPGTSWLLNGQALAPVDPVDNAMTGIINTAAELFNCPVLVSNTAAGNRSALNWSPNAPYSGNSIYGNVDGNPIMFDNMVGRHRSVGGRISVICIDQGEVDIGFIRNSGAAAWVAQWVYDIQAICAAFGQRYEDMLVLLAMTGTDAGTDNKNVDGANQGQINLWQAQRLLAAALPNAQLSHHKLDVLSDSAPLFSGDPDNTGFIHHKVFEYRNKLGPRFARAWAKKRGKSSYDLSGPKIAGMSRAGAVITLPINKDGAISVAADSGVLGGFQVVGAAGYDGSQTPLSFFTTVANIKAISSVTLSGENIIVTLLADPGGPVALRYAASASATSFDGNSPFGQQYYGTTDVALPPMIKGTYPGGEVVGLAPLVAGLVA
jgi:hypothetical protein